MFHKRLRELRKDAGLIQKEMAEALGVGKMTYNRYELGKKSPNTDFLLRMYKQGFDCYYLLTGIRLDEHGVPQGTYTDWTEAVMDMLAVSNDLNACVSLTPDLIKSIGEFSVEQRLNKSALCQLVKLIHEITLNNKH